MVRFQQPFSVFSYGSRVHLLARKNPETSERLIETEAQEWMTDCALLAQHGKRTTVCKSDLALSLLMRNEGWVGGKHKEIHEEVEAARAQSKKLRKSQRDCALPNADFSDASFMGSAVYLCPHAFQHRFSFSRTTQLQFSPACLGAEVKLPTVRQIEKMVFGD